MKQKLIGYGLIAAPFIAVEIGLALTCGWRLAILVPILALAFIVAAGCILKGADILGDTK